MSTSQIFGVRPFGSCLQLIPLPTPTPTPAPTACFATLANVQPCGGNVSNLINIGICPPTVITDGTQAINTILFGCQSGGFTAVNPVGTNNVFLQVPANCGGCYNVELNISVNILTPPSNLSRLYFGICRNGEDDFIIPPAVLQISGTPFAGAALIPVNVSTSATICLQSGDLIAPCASILGSGPVTLLILGFTMKVVRLGNC